MPNPTLPPQSHTGLSVLIYAPMMATIGGIERHLCLLAEACVRTGMQVTFLTTSNSLNDAARRELIGSGVEFLEQPAARGAASQLAKAWWLVKTVWRLRHRKWGVIYTNGQSVLAMVVWLAKRRGTRILHHHHTSADAAEQKTWHPGYRLALRLAPELLAVSEYTRHSLERAVGRNDVRCVLCLTPRIPTPERLRERLPREDQILHFGFIGRLVPEKGIDEICHLSTLPSLASIRWHLYGKGEAYPDGYFQKFPGVTYHGVYGSLEEYAEILQFLDAVALFSTHSEGLPLTLMEAMSAGLPWIATDRGGIRELAISWENCVVLPAFASPAEIAEQTAELAARLRGGQTSRSAQRRIYDQNFSPETVEARWFALLGTKG